MAAEDVAGTGADPSELEGGGLLQEIFTSPLNLLLLGLCIFLLYKIVRGDQPTASDSDDDEPPPLPRLKRRDFTPAELRRFDGVQDPRILMAINGKVFDVTKGRKFYGPGTAAGRGPQRQKKGPRHGAGSRRGEGERGAPGEVGAEWRQAGEGGAGRLPGRAGGKRRPRRAAGQWGTQNSRSAPPAPAWAGGRRLKRLSRGRVGEVARLEGGGRGWWYSRAQCWGVSKVSGLRVPGRRGWCPAGERK